MNAHHNTTVLLEFYINTEYFTINMFWKKKKTSDGGREHTSYFKITSVLQKHIVFLLLHERKS